MLLSDQIDQGAFTSARFSKNNNIAGFFCVVRSLTLVWNVKIISRQLYAEEEPDWHHLQCTVLYRKMTSQRWLNSRQDEKQRKSGLDWCVW
jgi:hypothetical protein